MRTIAPHLHKSLCLDEFDIAPITPVRGVPRVLANHFRVTANSPSLPIPVRGVPRVLANHFRVAKLKIIGRADIFTATRAAKGLLEGIPRENGAFDARRIAGRALESHQISHQSLINVLTKDH